jgi:hypothetical protein
MAVFVLGEVPMMGAQEQPTDNRWTISGVENLLGSLTGVMSVRLVAKPGSDIKEIHLLTTEEVTPKQTVRNVESALMAHFNLQIDHRKISVARTSVAPPSEPAVRPAPAPASLNGPAPVAVESPSQDRKSLLRPFPTTQEPRILFLGHQVETQRSQQVRMVVSVEWQGERYHGEAGGTGVNRGRFEALANATLDAAHSAAIANGADDFTLTLDGVKIINAFDRDYVIVSVHAMSGRTTTPLAGAAVVEESSDQAVIMATLQATDRWVRGRT